MATFPNSLAILFFAVAGVSFGYGCFKSKEWKNLDFQALAPSLKGIAILIAPFLALYGAAAIVQSDAAQGWAFFAGGALVPYLFNRMKMATEFSSLLLLMMVVGLSLLMPSFGGTEILSALAGVLVFKAHDVLVPAAVAGSEKPGVYVSEPEPQASSAGETSSASEKQAGSEEGGAAAGETPGKNSTTDSTIDSTIDSTVAATRPQASQRPLRLQAEEPKPVDFSDVLPAAIWLTSCYWSLGSTAATKALHLGLILGVLSVCILLKLCQAPLLHEDRVYLKRLVLSITGGLMVLIVAMKLLTAGHFDRLAMAAGGGFLGAYILQSMDADRNDHSAVKALKQIILIGIITLVVTRLFGDFGTLVVAATMLLPANRRAPQVAALYLIGRCLTQLFVAQYNSNVTGVNLNHPYTSAALYGGFLLAVVMALFIREMKSPVFLSIVFLVSCVAAPCAASYMVHSEPTASLLVSLTVAALLMTLSNTCLGDSEVPRVQALMLAPPLMAAVAILANGLLDAGNEATIHSRLVALGVVTFVFICLALIQRFVIPQSPLKTSGSQA